MLAAKGAAKAGCSYGGPVESVFKCGGAAQNSRPLLNEAKGTKGAGTSQGPTGRRVRSFTSPTANAFRQKLWGPGDERAATKNPVVLCIIAVCMGVCVTSQKGLIQEGEKKRGAREERDALSQPKTRGGQHIHTK